MKMQTKKTMAAMGAAAMLALGAWGATPDEQGFIRDWLISGPWPSYQVKDRGQGLETDFLQLEDEAQPYPGKRETATFVADWGVLVAGIGSANEWGFRTNAVFDASWTPLKAEAGIIRMDGRFAPIDDYFVTYAACYIDAPEARAARLAVGSDDDHKVFLDLDLVGKTTTSQDILPGMFKYDVTLPKGRSRLLFKLQDRTSGCGFCVQLLDREGKPMRDVAISLDARGTETTLAARLAERRSPERLRARLAAAREAGAKARAALAEARAQEATLSNACAKAEADLRAAYAAREAKYAAEHAAWAARGRASVDEPFEPCARRESLCLNGRWEASADGGATWRRTYVPSRQLDDFFYPWVYPVKDGRPRPGFEKILDPVNHARKAVYRTTFAWDGEHDLVLRCDAVLDVNAAFAVNGVACGTWAGDRGVVRIPLKGLRKGENALEIAVEVPGASLVSGLRGDIFLEALPKVRVDDVWVKTSWRKSALGAKTDLVNNTAEDVVATVSAYAVRDGRVCFRLPEKTAAIPAGGAATVKAQDVWADPLTWGIGGRFGEPNLYTLVTDVRVGGALVDRHEVEFGFREFWIFHTDFFLNGRRIFLQGDVGHLEVKDKRRRDVAWPLYRADGINIVRVHDSNSQWSLPAVRDADRMGMAVYAQMYPKLSEPGAPHSPTNFAPFEAWTATETHRRNLAAYERWWKDLRNHPSVLVWSTDNEILTQAWDTEAKAPFNVRNDRVGALYGDFMNTLDRSLVVTRDGDVGTWNHEARWCQDPPCRTANYHYPNYNNEAWAVNWQTTYEYRPVVFGEALYCSYLLVGGEGWVGGRPKLVAEKAETVEKCVGLYTALGIPCAVYMGLGLDGFTTIDDTGKGNPWGLKARDIAAYKANGTLPPGRRADQYPWLRIDWPAYSGEGERDPADHVPCSTWGTHAMNVYEAGVPSHVRNAVNDAYRKALRPQPPVDAGRFAEAIVEAAPWAEVWTTTPAGNRAGVRADAEGRAWFRSLAPGRRVFTSGGKSAEVDLPARGAAVANPGFEGIPRVALP